MLNHLVLGGEEHAVSLGQVLGRCIHNAQFLPAPGPILAVVISVIETAFRALLVILARNLLPGGSHDGRTRLRAIASAPAAAAAQHQAHAATLAISLETRAHQS